MLWDVLLHGLDVIVATLQLPVHTRVVDADEKRFVLTTFSLPTKK